MKKTKRKPTVMTTVPRSEWEDQHEHLIGVWKSRKYLAKLYRYENGLSISVSYTEESVSGRLNDNIPLGDIEQIIREIGFS